MKFTFGLIFFFLISCSSANDSITPNSASSEASEEASGPGIEQTEVAPQTIDERIAEIKEMYKAVQNTKEKKECKEAVKITMEGFDDESEQFPFENTASECNYATGYTVKEINLYGYEWAETTKFYYKNGILFFAFSEGGAEACIYEYRVYYDNAGEVIRVLVAENECTGDAPGESKDVTGQEAADQARFTVDYALQECESILAQ